jgi:hypothetical protein
MFLLFFVGIALSTVTTAGAGLPTSSSYGIKEEVPKEFRDRYQRWKTELLATDDGQPEPVMFAGRAGDSVRFFTIFAPGGTHPGWLTPAELKLVSEWIDIGEQYFNDPCAAPRD